MKKYDVVQFNENHKWCGCLGIIEEINDERIMVGVPIPKNEEGTGTAYIFVKKEEIEYIGKAIMIGS